MGEKDISDPTPLLELMLGLAKETNELPHSNLWGNLAFFYELYLYGSAASLSLIHI